MRLDDDFDYEYDYEDHHGRMNMGAAVIVVSVFILAILVFVVLINQKPVRTNNAVKPVEEMEQVAEENGVKLDEFGYPETSQLVDSSGLTPDDLDFWNMYDEEEEIEPDVPGEDEKESSKESEENKSDDKNDSGNSKDKNNKDKNNKDKDSKDKKGEDSDSEEEKDSKDDGKHTLIEYSDGTEEWVVISPYLPKNTYDFTKLVTNDDQMKYELDGKSVSFIGVDISKYQGTVDFYRLKDAGIDYVMLRVGARGYSSGKIIMDEYFADNIKRATEAGLDVGVYFYSQALTEEEAIEEANVVIQSLAGYTLQYPVAFDMEYVENDTARVESLSRAEKTTITKAFLDTIQAAGYRAMIYGNKEWLIKRIDLSKLTDYEVWLSQQKDMPDYPYKFSMWQYTTSAEINGIDGYANLNICFIDYSAK